MITTSELEKLWKKKVKLITTDNETIIGWFLGYTEDDEDEDGNECSSISIDSESIHYIIFLYEIKSIEEFL